MVLFLVAQCCGLARQDRSMCLSYDAGSASLANAARKGEVSEREGEMGEKERASKSVCVCVWFQWATGQFRETEG